MTRVAVLLASLLAGACASLPPEEDLLTARASAALARRGLEADILRLVDNVLRHEPGPPPHAPAAVRALLARPLAAADAAEIFRSAVPPEVLGFDVAGPSATLEELLAQYLPALAQAQGLLREATRDARFDTAQIVKAMHSGEDPAAYLLELARTDEALVRRAVAQFTRATARFTSALRSVPFPEQAQRFKSLVGEVAIGTRGDDRHGPEAALIIDPGGNDHYERAPLAGGVSVVVDLAGNDVYRGPDVVVQGLGALVDFSGDDRYEAAGPGLAAVVLGTSLLVDFSGHDAYEAAVFAQGAAAFGLGALLDYQGDDRYRIGAAGQGYGLAGGVGLLWDRAGNDRYTASGVEDAYARGGRVSFAQGAAFGLRTMLAGGVGILRDDAGDDDYEAQMFAQGTGYYYGLGLAWDRAGNDRWRAVRYAQGNGVHEAVGVLREEAGDDRYELSYGVGRRSPCGTQWSAPRARTRRARSRLPWRSRYASACRRRRSSTGLRRPCKSTRVARCAPRRSGWKTRRAQRKRRCAPRAGGCRPAHLRPLPGLVPMFRPSFGYPLSCAVGFLSSQI